MSTLEKLRYAIRYGGMYPYTNRDISDFELRHIHPEKKKMLLNVYKEVKGNK